MLVVCAWDLLNHRRQYRQGEKVDLIVNKVELDHSQLDYSYYLLPFVCPPSHDLSPLALLLAEILLGDRKWELAYDLKFGVDMPCKRLCDFVARQKGVTKATQLIHDGYVIHWEVDGLPGATTYTQGKRTFYAAGFPLGFEAKGKAYIHNHVQLVFRTHRDQATGLWSIVGFEVYPKSVLNEKCPGLRKNFENFALPPTRDSKGDAIPVAVTIPWTYSVYWREDKLMDYENRWDLYQQTLVNRRNLKVHWMLLLLSLTVIMLMTLVVTVVVLSMVHKDINTSRPGLPQFYDGTPKPSPAKWSQLASQVLTRPWAPLMLAILVAMGIQTLVACLGVLVILAINFWFFDTLRGAVAVIERHQGPILTLAIVVLVLLGIILTYGGVLFYKLVTNHLLNTPYSKRKIMVLSILFAGALPAVVVATVLVLNFFVWAKQLSTALPLGTIVTVLLFLGLVQIPLGMVGGFYANRQRFDPKSFLTLTAAGVQEKLSVSGRRYIWITNPLFSTVVFGLFPFMLIYVELTYVFHALWLEKTTYYTYGFLLVAFVLLIIIVAECTIVAIYTSLAVYNDPNWHWLAYRCGALVGVYVFGFVTYYFFAYLDVREWVSVLVYFSYMLLMLICLGVACGALGVLTGLFFVKRVFGSLKND